MKLDELTIGELKEAKALLSSGCMKPQRETGGEVRIVVLQRGWVVVGRFYQKGSKCRVENGYVIRRWGTSEGLGQLATQGPLTETKLEPTPTIRFHELTIVQSIDCVEEKWRAKSPRA